MRNTLGLGGVAAAIASLVLIPAPSGAVGRSATLASRPAPPQRAMVRDSTAAFDANELRLHVSNLGWLPFLDSSALEWPRGTGRAVIFAGGLWIGARVGADTLVTVAEYSTEYAAGPLTASGTPVDPAESDPIHRVYSIRRCDDAASNPDWAAWPVALGAPVDLSGAPALIGEQMLWSVTNDAIAAHHTNKTGHTAPLGVEVRQTVFGFRRGGDLDRVVFLSFDLLNRGAHQLDSAYIALWFDSDLGSAGDDLVGCDTTLDLGFTYNASDADPVYGAHTPAVGCALLQGPIVAGDTLRMTGFGRQLKNYNEPMNHGMAYRRMKLGLPDPDKPPPYPCDSPGTRFEVSGDPVTATGCLDTLPADRRMMLSSGPFTLMPGESQRVVAALAVGGRPDDGDRLSNLTRLRETVREARDLYRAGFIGAPPAPSCDARLRLLAASPNPARESQRFEILVGGNAHRLAVHIVDLAGRRVWTRTFAGLQPGIQSFEWDGRGDDGQSLPPGIYFVRTDDGREVSARRVVRLR